MDTLEKKEVFTRALTTKDSSEDNFRKYSNQVGRKESSVILGASTKAVNVSILSKTESEFNKSNVSMSDRRPEIIVWDFLYEDEVTGLSKYEDW